jgi:formylglycine-generating enzyme required for sulfatase activity
MVAVPSGNFSMGSSVNEPERDSQQESPIHIVIARPFAVGKYAVTFDEWDACAADGGCNGYRPSDEGWGRGRRPVINVSYDDAKRYVGWLSRKTGTPYRLLSEAEREYVARAGTSTPFWWGASITPRQANYRASIAYEGGGSTGEYRQKTLPVDSFQPNGWGLQNVHGNVWEWTDDCWNIGNDGNPGNGSPRYGRADCDRRVRRGGSWESGPKYLRSATRGAYPTDYRGTDIGFRVARSIASQ